MSTITARVHQFRMRDDQRRTLIDHGGIRLLELGTFAAGPGQTERVDTALTRWLKVFFFRPGASRVRSEDGLQPNQR
jgi:hypothetical protein